MGHKPHKKRTVPTATNSLQDECIRVQKVYDWVTDQLEVNKTIHFTEEQQLAIDAALADPTRRPLRIVCNTPEPPPLFPLSGGIQEGEGFYCEQIGEKRDVNVAIPGGKTADAQLVELLFTTEVTVLVVDRNGVVVTEVDTTASVLEGFVLCFPDGTYLFCNISKILCRIPSGSVILKTPAPRRVDLQVIFCVDIQCEAEVKLEVLAKFCTPRDNDLKAEEDVIIVECPTIDFPDQCPDIYPRPNCDCSLTGEASGEVRSGGEHNEHGEYGEHEECGECEEHGEYGEHDEHGKHGKHGKKHSKDGKGNLSISVDICPDCSLHRSSLELNFLDRNSDDGHKDFTFTATSFDQSTLVCKEVYDGLKFIIEGTGVTDHGKKLDFELAVLDGKKHQFFEVRLQNRRGRVEFDSGTVKVRDGELTVDDCITFDDIKYKQQP
ncbi:MAG: hypothetical protein WBV93_06955 [Anaerobacillus sp.]